MTRRICMDCGRIFKPNKAKQYRCLPHHRAFERARDAKKRASRRARGLPVGGSRTPSKIRLAVLERDGYRCTWCGAPANTVDHLIPIVKGGTSDPSNLVAACRSCNSKRGAGRRV